MQTLHELKPRGKRGGCHFTTTSRLTEIRFISRLSMIVRVNVVLNRTVVDSD